MTGLIGRKIGMMQFYNAEGNVVPVTVVETGPCVVVQKKERPLMDTLRCKSALAARRRSGSTKPRKAIWPRPAKAPSRCCANFVSMMFRGYEVGQEIKAGDLFKIGDLIDVSGISKGHGFTGVIKRWSFAGFPVPMAPMNIFATAVPSVTALIPGACAKGKKMAGHWGNEQVSTQNLVVVDIRAEENLMFVRGAVPGAKHGVVILRPAVKR